MHNRQLRILRPCYFDSEGLFSNTEHRPAPCRWITQALEINTTVHFYTRIESKLVRLLFFRYGMPVHGFLELEINMLSL